jgi:RNA polymerase sigma factor (sigma-70 family)
MFEERFDELAGLAHRTAFRILGSRAEAEEVAQETMAKAYARWRRVRDHARPWVCRVAANEAIGVLRKRRSSPDLPQQAPAADDAALDRLDLQQALLTLPRRQREVLVLRYLLDLPERQVADELRISAGAVKTHAHRALGALRASLTLTPEVRSTDARTEVL